MDVLVDTSVWISFFRGRKEDARANAALDYLLSGDEAVVNEVVLSELLPPIMVRKEMVLAETLSCLRKLELKIDWDNLRTLQFACITHGINKVGLTDLMIAQQAMAADVPVFSLDKHFRLMAKWLPLKIWPQ